MKHELHRTGWMAVAGVLLASCANPSINLSTPEPIKVDIAVTLDVYQHGEKEGAAKPGSTPSALAGDAGEQSRRRQRSGDIQTFKNSRLVGEDSDGLLSVRTAPPGDYGKYVKTTVAAENEDRTALMEKQAREKKMSLGDVKKQQAQLFRDQAFNGEWIEAPQPDGSYRWVQKGQQ